MAARLTLLGMPNELKELISTFIAPDDCFALSLASKHARATFTRALAKTITQSGPPVLFFQLTTAGSFDAALLRALARYHPGTGLTPQFASSVGARDKQIAKTIQRYKSEPDAAVGELLRLSGCGFREKTYRLRQLHEAMSDAVRRSIRWTRHLVATLTLHTREIPDEKALEGFLRYLLHSGASPAGLVRRGRLLIDTCVTPLAGKSPQETDLRETIYFDGELQDHPVGILLAQMMARKPSRGHIPRVRAVELTRLATMLVRDDTVDNRTFLHEWTAQGHTHPILTAGNILNYAVRVYGKLSRSTGEDNTAAKQAMMVFIRHVLSLDDTMVNGRIRDLEMVNDLDQEVRHRVFPPSVGHSTVGATTLQSPLMQAVTLDDVELVTTLLDHGAHLETEDDRGRTALMLSRSRAVMECLVRRGANVTKTTRMGNVLHALLYPLFESGLDRRAMSPHYLFYNLPDIGTDLSANKVARLVETVIRLAPSRADREALARHTNAAGINPIALAIAQTSQGARKSKSGYGIIGAIAPYADVNARIRYPHQQAAVCDTLSHTNPGWDDRRPLGIVFRAWKDDIRQLENARGGHCPASIQRDGLVIHTLLDNGATMGAQMAQDASDLRRTWERKKPRTDPGVTIKSVVLSCLTG